MYNSRSKKATEFIDHEEIGATLAYAQKACTNQALVEQLLAQAEAGKGLDYKEAAVLLACEDLAVLEKIFSIAKALKEKLYGQRIVMFAPLYLSNHCVNGCRYCPYHYKNKEMKRRKLTQEEIIKEVIALQDMGHKRLALEAGEHPTEAPIEYILESMQTIYGVQHKNGQIRRVNVNIAATTVENYRKLKEAGIGTYILFQETYHKEHYEYLHPTGPKSDYAYHTEAMDRAMAGGIDDVGIGVLFGLNKYRYDFVGLLMHVKHLEDAMGVGPHTISVPRIRPADDVDLAEYTDAIPDEIFEKIVAILRLAVPYTGLIISTRESQDVREKVLQIGVTQVSGGSSTSVGGYVEPEEENTAQFELNDTRTLDEIVGWLVEKGYVPSFCTACYREGRTGDRFMRLIKSGQIANVCQANALMTLKEYLEDYASEETKQKGEALIEAQIPQIESEKVKEIVKQHLDDLHAGQRDFRF